jgi:hypothetical protein
MTLQRERKLKMDDTVSGTYGSGSGTYLKADDLHGEDWELSIAGWEKREMDQTDFETGEKYKKWKAILSFHGEERKLVLNATNANAIKAAYGDRYDDWVGKVIIIFQGEWNGKPALRVRTPKAVKKVSPSGAQAKKQAQDELNPPPNDAIPF